MSRKERIINILQALNPSYLQVVDETEKHKGHSALSNFLDKKDNTHIHNYNIETHFSIEITAEILSKMPLLIAHKKIKQSLKEEFASGLHSISIKII